MRGRLTKIAVVFLVATIAAGGVFCFSCVLSPSIAFAKTPSEQTFQSEWNGCASSSHAQIIKQTTCLAQNGHNTPIAAHLNGSKQQSDLQIAAMIPVAPFTPAQFVPPPLSSFVSGLDSQGPPARSLAKTIIKRE